MKIKKFHSRNRNLFFDVLAHDNKLREIHLCDCKIAFVYIG